jgi:small nuclear ribonucleoprotein B and B'
MLSLINWRLKVTINDGRAFIGQMLAFDRHMNLVLADCEEFRRVRPKKKPGESEAGPEQEMKRALGLVILRGETVVSLSVEGPPPVQDEDKKNAVRVTLIPASLFRNTISLSFFFHFSSFNPAPAWPRSRDASWARNGNGPSRCVLLFALSISIGSNCHPLWNDSGRPSLCKTSNAVCATWYARSTSWLPSAWVPTGGAFPPPSWVRWPSSPRVRQSSGCHRGSDWLNVHNRFQPPPQQ